MTIIILDYINGVNKQFIFLGLSFAGNFPLTGLNLGGAVTDTAATRTTHATSGNKNKFSIRKKSLNMIFMCTEAKRRAYQIFV